jgi:hypothetical protein
VDGCARQCLAKLGAGIDEGGARDMQSHHLHHHLVRVGGAVEGTGARGVVGSGLSFQQLGLACLSFRIELPDPLLLLIGEA